MGQHSKPDDDAAASDGATRGITMWTTAFWADAGERALKTAAQALLSLWLVGDVFNVLDVAWGPAFGVAAGAAVVSLLTSIVSAPVGDKGTASLVSSGQ
jgi:hypothetical protein